MEADKAALELALLLQEVRQILQSNGEYEDDDDAIDEEKRFVHGKRYFIDFSFEVSLSSVY
jgi:hypothetical protein